MINSTRTDTSLIGRWWWTVDRWTLVALMTLLGVGAMLALAATPAVAERIGFGTYYFVQRQFIYLLLSLAIMLAISLAPPQALRRIALLGLVIFTVLTLLTLFSGAEVKGASRWLRLGGLSLQPSEFIKPTFAVVAAWLFAQRNLNDRFPGYALATALFIGLLTILLLQPDVGMAIVLAAIWCLQFFLAGMPVYLVAVLCGGFILLALGSYFTFDHVSSRVDRFLDPDSGDNYQIDRAMEAFTNGGFFGTGPGEGTIKQNLPDAHADFIFAVAAEEFGVLLCLLIIALFAFVVLRGFTRIMKNSDLFAVLAVAGLLAQFGLQAIINIASTAHLIPTKGMTLPFISYGGSSMISISFAMGVVLALTRERTGGTS